MYSTSRDTRLCISNNKVIIQQVVMEWNRKINEISTKMKKRVNHAHGMWITHLNFAVYVFYITQIQNQSEKRLVFIFYSLPLHLVGFTCKLIKTVVKYMRKFYLKFRKI